VGDHVDAITTGLPEWASTPETRLGLSEALSNAILHGVHRIPKRADAPLDSALELEHWLEIAVSTHDVVQTITILIVEDVTLVTFVVADPGEGFDAASTARSASRGLGILAATFDDVAWNHRGNVLALRVQKRA
jgi:anti-sigma regulatory factor (Ser/Thr protein kinase)